MIDEADSRIVAELVSIPGGQGMKAYLARPRRRGRRSAVLVTGREVNERTFGMTRQVAAGGFIALAVQDLGPLAQAALRYLRSRSDCTGRVGAIGEARPEQYWLQVENGEAAGLSWRRSLIFLKANLG
jgi:hypothetical protein